MAARNAVSFKSSELDRSIRASMNCESKVKPDLIEEYVSALKSKGAVSTSNRSPHTGNTTWVL